MPEQNTVERQLVQEIQNVAAVAQAIISCQKYSITGFAKCLIVEMVNRQAKDNDAESSIVEFAPWVALCCNKKSTSSDM